jgi:hypothetical protein
MGTPKKPPPVLFFASVIFGDSDAVGPAERELETMIGNIREKTPLAPFHHSNYYEDEMGAKLTRFFLLFDPLIERDRLAEIKLATNGVEEGLCLNGRRRVNIDAGYMALEHVILATTKGFAHRVYLGRGIFADLTLIYRNGTYGPIEWTYPDYGSEAVISMFNGWREGYKRTLKTTKNSNDK